MVYYAAVADKMLPHLKDRPLSLVRDTANDLAKTFFQKHQLPGMPKTLKAGQLTKMKGTESRILWIEDLAGLVGGVQMNTLEFHIWGSDRHMPDLPERMVFDIDPDEGLGFEDVKHAATDIRDILAAISLQSWPLVSGGKGVHVVVPLVPNADWDAVKSFCQNFDVLLAKTEPHRFVANMSKAKQGPHVPRLPAERPRQHRDMPLVNSSPGWWDRSSAGNLGGTGWPRSSERLRHFYRCRTSAETRCLGRALRRKTGSNEAYPGRRATPIGCHRRSSTCFVVRGAAAVAPPSLSHLDRVDRGALEWSSSSVSYAHDVVAHRFLAGGFLDQCLEKVSRVQHPHSSRLFVHYGDVLGTTGFHAEP